MSSTIARIRVAVATTLVVAVFSGCATSTTEEAPKSGATASVAVSSATSQTPATLPRGGRTVFANHRIVAYYGAADDGGLGILGRGTPEQAADRLNEQARAYDRPDKPVLPTMELITSIADPTPGPNGCYAHAAALGDAWRYLKAARAHHQMLILDIQPGQCDFLSQTRQWAPLLAQPDVGLGLDAEWRMPPGVIPGQQIGTVSAEEINTVTRWLVGLSRKYSLPQKPVVLHQFTPLMITDLPAIEIPQELAMISHTDGFGSVHEKLAKYHELNSPRMYSGFKLFYTEDIGLLQPAQVLNLQPAPDYISYQ